LLQYIHRLRISETFTIEDTKLFGKLHFHSTEPGSLVIFSAKKPTKQLLSYGAILMRHHLGNKNDFDSIKITIVHDKKVKSGNVEQLSNDDHYLQKQATFLKSEISFATCCTEPIVQLESKNWFNVPHARRYFIDIVLG